MEVYEAKHSYKQVADSVLTFNSGDTFYILGRPSEKWWFAKRTVDSAFGYVPAVYLQPAKQKVIGKLVPEARRGSREYDIHMKALAEIHKKVAPSSAHVIEAALAMETKPKQSSTKTPQKEKHPSSAGPSFHHTQPRHHSHHKSSNPHRRQSAQDSHDHQSESMKEKRSASLTESSPLPQRLSQRKSSDGVGGNYLQYEKNNTSSSHEHRSKISHNPSRDGKSRKDSSSHEHSSRGNAHSAPSDGKARKHSSSHEHSSKSTSHTQSGDGRSGKTSSSHDHSSKSSFHPTTDDRKSRKNSSHERSFKSSHYPSDDSKSRKEVPSHEHSSRGNSHTPPGDGKARKHSSSHDRSSKSSSHTTASNRKSRKNSSHECSFRSSHNPSGDCKSRKDSSSQGHSSSDNSHTPPSHGKARKHSSSHEHSFKNISHTQSGDGKHRKENQSQSVKERRSTSLTESSPLPQRLSQRKSSDGVGGNYPRYEKNNNIVGTPWSHTGSRKEPDRSSSHDHNSESSSHTATSDGKSRKDSSSHEHSAKSTTYTSSSRDGNSRENSSHSRSGDSNARKTISLTEDGKIRKVSHPGGNDAHKENSSCSEDPDTENVPSSQRYDGSTDKKCPPASEDKDSLEVSPPSSADGSSQRASPPSPVEGAARKSSTSSSIASSSLSEDESTSAVLASRKMISVDNENNLPEHLQNFPSPPLLSPPPPDYDIEGDAFTFTNGKPYHHQMNISSHPDGDRIPMNEQNEDDVHLIKPKPLVNPCIQSKERMDLHRELKHSGRKVLDQPELKKVFRDRKITEKKKEADEFTKSRRTSMEIKLMERQERLEKEAEKEKLAKEGIVENEEEASKPEFAKLKLRHTNAAKT